MGVIPNLIPVESSRFPTDVGLWTSSQAIKRSTTQSFVSGIPSISVTANGSGSGKISISQVDVTEAYRGTTVRFFAWVYLKSSSPCTVSLTTSSTSASAVVEATENLRGLEWSLVSVESDPLDENANSRASMSVEVTGLSSGEEFFVAIPALTVPEMVFRSVSCDETYLRLPDYMRRADLDQVEPVVPLRRFIDVLTTLANDIDTTWNLFYYLPPDDNLPPEANNGTSIRSLLTTPSLADFKTVNWLAMVVGATLRDPASGFTSWGSLLENADTNTNGQTTWAELVSEVDGPDANSTMDWFEIEGFSPSTVSFPYRQWQVESAAYGLRGGSVASIKAAVLQAFKESERSTKTVTVSADPADPFLILVNVAGMTVDDEGKVTDYVKPAIPAGFGLTVSAV